MDAQSVRHLAEDLPGRTRVDLQRDRGQGVVEPEGDVFAVAGTYREPDAVFREIRPFGAVDEHMILPHIFAEIIVLPDESADSVVIDIVDVIENSADLRRCLLGKKPRCLADLLDIGGGTGTRHAIRIAHVPVDDIVVDDDLVEHAVEALIMEDE